VGKSLNIPKTGKSETPVGRSKRNLNRTRSVRPNCRGGRGLTGRPSGEGSPTCEGRSPTISLHQMRSYVTMGDLSKGQGGLERRRPGDLP